MPGHLKNFILGTFGVFLSIIGMIFLLEIITTGQIITQISFLKSIKILAILLIYSAVLGGGFALWATDKIERMKLYDEKDES